MKKKIFYENKNLIDKNINDIYPNNYYKMTESIKDIIKVKKKYLLTRLSSKFYLDKSGKNKLLKENDVNNNDRMSDFIKNNIAKSHVKNYKFRIYKRFIIEGTLNSSAIVYNFVTKELRFMTKGMPEDIIDKCDNNSLPFNISNIISSYRKMGFIIIICASKIIDIDDYKDSDNIEDYMNDLTFCGFITLKYKIKNEIINSIYDLKQFNCNFIITSGDNLYNSLSIGFLSNIIHEKNIFIFEKDEKKKLIIRNIYRTKNENEDKEEKEKEEKSVNASYDKYSKKRANISDSPNSIRISNGNTLLSQKIKKIKNKNNNNIKIKPDDSEKREFFQETNKDENSKRNIYRKKGSIHRNYKTSKNLLDYVKNDENDDEKELTPKNTEFSERKKIINNENERSLSIINTINNSTKLNKKLNLINNKGNQDKYTKKRTKNINEFIYKNITFLEKYYYYPGIFENYEELSNNCIYCVSGKAFNFLYKYKEKKQCKLILEKIHQNCKIFYNMSSSDKSLVIDYYREYPDSYICTIGENQSDMDSIMTSNVGISLKAPKNINTIFSHFYCSNSSIIAIKNIIKEGRTLNENILLLKITCGFYSMILNSYIICCFLREMVVINNQLDFLEINFCIMIILAFTGHYDDNCEETNPLIKNKYLYNFHCISQIVGIFLLKIGTIYLECNFFIGNYNVDKREIDVIFCSYYFIFCIEQLFSTIFVFNLISFYRKNPFTNKYFIIYNLIVLIYCLLLLTLNSSNYKFDIFNITHFEFHEELLDSFDDRNKMSCFKILIIDFFSTLIFSRIIFLIFNRLAQNNS